MKWLSLKSIRNWILNFKVSWTTRYHKKSEQISMKRKCWNCYLKLEFKMNRSKNIHLSSQKTFANHYFFTISNLDRTFNWIFKSCSKLLKFFRSLLDSSRPFSFGKWTSIWYWNAIHERGKMLKCRWNGYVRVFDFTAATRNIFNQPHRSTE